MHPEFWKGLIFGALFAGTVAALCARGIIAAAYRQIRQRDRENAELLFLVECLRKPPPNGGWRGDRAKQKGPAGDTGPVTPTHAPRRQ